jgi:antitoxin YefM
MRRATCSQAQASLADLIDEVNRDHTIVLIQRRSAADVAMLPAADLSGLLETIYLLRSPINARRLLSALDRATDRDTLSKDLSNAISPEEAEL